MFILFAIKAIEVHTQMRAQTTIIVNGGKIVDLSLVVRKPDFVHANNKVAGITSDRRQLKTLILSMNIDQKSLETEFSIAICRLTGDIWPSKTLLAIQNKIFEPGSRLFRAFSIAAYPLWACNLISTFVVCSLECTNPELATCKISMFLLV